MTTAQVKIPSKLRPVFRGRADVRGAHGGRGSAKTRSFAKMAALRGWEYGNKGQGGIILCARQFMNSLDDSSLEECKRAIEDEPFLAAYYEVGERYIKSRDGRISFAFAGLDRNIVSIKSKGRILVCWVDEAEPVTEEAFSILVPTLREEGTGWNAELWVTWNSKRREAAVEKRYRNSKDPLVKVVQLNWRDNPRFPAKLERERQRDLKERPEQYPHIWEGEYVSMDALQLVAAQWIVAAFERKFVQLYDGTHPRTRISVDVADGGEDASVITICDHYSGFVHARKQWQHWFPSSRSPILLADEVIRLWISMGLAAGSADIVVDSLGVGAGCAGALMTAVYPPGHPRAGQPMNLPVTAYKGGETEGVNTALYRNRRVQSFIGLRNDHRDGKIVYAEDFLASPAERAEFEAQLCSVRMAVSTERVDDLETKEKMRKAGIKSPDRADSLAMQYATGAPDLAARAGAPLLVSGELMTAESEAAHADW